MKILQTKFEQEYVRCVRNEEECVCSVCLFRCNIFIDIRIIKEMSGSVASGTPCIISKCCSLWYAACNAHAPYCHMWTARLNNTFPYYLINGTILENVVDHKACVVIFNITFFKHFPF